MLVVVGHVELQPGGELAGGRLQLGSWASHSVQPTSIVD